MSKSSSKNICDAISSKDARILEAPLMLFQPHRILIMKALATHGQIEFRDLRRVFSVSDGKLASHLRPLEREGYVVVHKKIVGRPMGTTYELTPQCSEKFEEFRAIVKQVV